MTKRALIKAAHVRNEQFITNLREIIELVPLLCSWQAIRIQARTDGKIEDAQILNAIPRLETALAKVIMDRLEALFDTWPNAVWLFFPETGTSGWIRLLNQFHSNIVPCYFPEAPRCQLWRSKRVSWHRWCGVAPRIRKESLRTFRIWDQFKEGRSAMEIVRREFPSRTVTRSQKSKKELMTVHRSMERASQLIYGQPLSRNRKIRRLPGFNHVDHMEMCIRCRNASTSEQLCPTARDYLNQDQRGFLHNWTSI